MKQVIVIEEFIDKLADKTRRVGEVFEVTEGRYRVLAGQNDYGRPFVKETESEGRDLAKLSKSELQTLLTEKGISYDKKDTKDELVALLTAEKADK